MHAPRPSFTSSRLAALLRRAHVVIRHHRHYRQPIDARAVVERVPAAAARPGEDVVQYRALLEEAVRSLIHDVR